MQYLLLCTCVYLYTFFPGIWKPVMEFLTEKISTMESVNIMVGPAFDKNHDSLPDDKNSIRFVFNHSNILCFTDVYKQGNVLIE